MTVSLDVSLPLWKAEHVMRMFSMRPQTVVVTLDGRIFLSHTSCDVRSDDAGGGIFMHQTSIIYVLRSGERQITKYPYWPI